MAKLLVEVALPLDQAYVTQPLTRGVAGRLTPTRANGQPALALYARDTGANLYRALGLLVPTLAGERVSAITRFEVGVLPHFGLPRTLPSAEIPAPQVRLR